MNLYAFVHNDPLIYLDLYGLEAFSSQNNNTDWRSWKPDLSSPRGLSNWGMPPPAQAYRSRFAPHYYINGIQNRFVDCLAVGNTLLNTFGRNANIIPLHSPSRGTMMRDLKSVKHVLNRPNYRNSFVQRLNRELRFQCLLADGYQDPRKIFITCFSRGVGETYHAIKNFTYEQRNRLCITACGGIMTLPRNLGFFVTNLISDGDWCSLNLNRLWGKNSDARRERLAELEKTTNVTILPQIGKGQWGNGDHFFQSPTYQDGIRKETFPIYRKYGELR